jgi:hypothetical protein
MLFHISLVGLSVHNNFCGTFEACAYLYVSKYPRYLSVYPRMCARSMHECILGRMFECIYAFACGCALLCALSCV